MEFVMLLIVVAIIAIVLKVAFWVFVIKAGIDLFHTHQRAFDRELHTLQTDLGQLRIGSMQAGPQASQRLALDFARAQNELAHLHRLRREQAELNLSSMRGELASLGVFIDAG